jgi:hypothetical protein
MHGTTVVYPHEYPYHFFCLVHIFSHFSTTIRAVFRPSCNTKRSVVGVWRRDTNDCHDDRAHSRDRITGGPGPAGARTICNNSARSTAKTTTGRARAVAELSGRHQATASVLLPYNTGHGAVRPYEWMDHRCRHVLRSGQYTLCIGCVSG